MIATILSTIITMEVINYSGYTEVDSAMIKKIESLASLLKESNQNNEQLSKEVGIGSSSLCRWENQQADVKGSQLIILAKFFNVTSDYLLGIADY